MRAWWLLVGVVAACGLRSSTTHDEVDGAVVDFVDAPNAPDAGELSPPIPTCVAPSDAGPCNVKVTAQLMSWETQAPAAAPAQVAVHAAWNVPQIFPTTCPPYQRADGTIVTFTLCPSPRPYALALIVTGTGLGLSIDDKALPFACTQDCGFGSTAVPYPTWILTRTTLDAWEHAPGLSGLDFGTHGLAVVTYRDKTGKPLAGVTPIQAAVVGGPKPLVPGVEVFFLADDRVSFKPSGTTTTGASGSVVVPLVAGRPKYLTGTGGGVVNAFEDAVGVATAADAVFFEQIDEKQ